MKQKDKIDILYETRLVNVYLTESVRTLFCLRHFYGGIETSKNSAFFNQARINYQILGRR